jgi:hypothetical protein
MQKETASIYIIQFQSTIDLQHPVADISQICRSSKIDKNAKFTVHAPQEPGLHMIWSKVSYHYSFRQAEGRTYPTTAMLRAGGTRSLRGYASIRTRRKSWLKNRIISGPLEKEVMW